MKTRLRCCCIQFMVAFLFTGYSNCQAAARYQPDVDSVPSGQTLQWSFDSEQAGGLPAGAHAFSGKWQVRPEADAPSRPNVLCQSGVAEYPALCFSGKVFTDAVISVRFKLLAGSEDRAAGIIFRILDKDNYYVLRANALEDNVNIYKYVDGRRFEIQESSVKVPSGRWQQLRVEVRGDTIRGFLNGKLVVETRDATFKAGKVGLWTKADSATCFDNVTATAR
jgi:hypothetical protein